jgi:hypothetical protein
MDVMHHVGRRARLAVEGHEDQPPGIEAGEQRGDHQSAEGVSAGGLALCADIGRLDDRVLGEEAGGADQRAGMPTPVSASVPIIIIQ